MCSVIFLCLVQTTACIRYYTSLTLLCLIKNSVNDYSDLVKEVNRMNNWRDKTLVNTKNHRLSFGRVCDLPGQRRNLSKRASDYIVSNQVRRYRNHMKFGASDLHDNDVSSVTHPALVMKELISMGVAMYTNQQRLGIGCADSCISTDDTDMGGGDSNAAGSGTSKCVYGSTGAMNLMSDADSLPDFRCLVEQ